MALGQMGTSRGFDVKTRMGCVHVLLGFFNALITFDGAYAASALGKAPIVSCLQLKGFTVAPSNIGFSSGAAHVTEAKEAQVDAVENGKKAYCQVTGEIASTTAGASPIRFEVNLPASWNERSLMMGGGGYNGILIDGLGPVRDAPPGDPSPLAEGYVTFGTDSGHATRGLTDPEPGRFALNDEMFRNFAFEAYKKVSDVASVLIRNYYGQASRYRYYMGGSEGGREALTVAQRFPEDFDGVVSVVPVISWTGLFTGFVDYAQPQFRGGALNEAKIHLVAQAVMDACDGLDGIKDGVVSNYLACPAKFSIETLRCVNGADTGDTCLSDAQLTTLKAAYGTTELPEALANGTKTYPGRLFGGEVQGEGEGISRWLGSTGAPSEPAKITDGRGVLYGDNFVRFVVMGDPLGDLRTYDPAKYKARLRTISELMDSTNTDLSAFYKRGGKLIIRENAGDFAQSPRVGFRYYEDLVRRFGQATADKFVRLYVSPGSAHGGQARSFATGATVPTSHNLLGDLDHWVTTGQAPADALIQVNVAKDFPQKVLSARPMCRYPNYPQYVSGDLTKVDSYRCIQSAP